MKIAIIYDRANKWGGAERLLLSLHELFPTAELFTPLHAVGLNWTQKFPNIKTSPLNEIPFLRNKHQYLSILMPIAFESYNFEKYDLVISVTSEAAKGVLTSPSVLHICYCLTPTRYLWSHEETYFGRKFLKLLSTPAVKYLKKWEVTASARPDVMVAISNEVKNRIKNYYARESEVIYPPLMLSTKDSAPARRKDYYLFVGRLVPYKKADLVIEAFNKLNKKLLIVGTGSSEKKLKKRAGKNIKFAGFVSDKTLVKHYKEARGLLFPQYEDFGLVAIEAMAFGTPVIAYRRGGALDTVIEGKTGIFFDKQEPDSLIAAVELFETIDFDDKIIMKHAQKFSYKNFERSFKELISKYYKK